MAEKQRLATRSRSGELDDARQAAAALVQFRTALRGYDASREGMERVRAIAEVVAASRGLVEIVEPITNDDWASLSQIRKRYRAFAADHQIPVLARYCDARGLLAALFF